MCNKDVYMSETVTLRIPRELQEKMKKYEINWSNVLRNAVEEVVRRCELRETAKIVDMIRGKTRYGVFDSTKVIREERGRIE